MDDPYTGPGNWYICHLILPYKLNTPTQHLSESVYTCPDLVAFGWAEWDMILAEHQV